MNVSSGKLVLALVLLQSAAAQEPEPFRLAVDVDLVVLHATVRDRNGLIISDLREQDFEVYEDGVRQTIRLFHYEDVPVTVGIIVDHSGSMRAKLPEVIAAARSFVKASNPDDEMFVVNFNERVSLGLPESTPFTNNSAELERAISRQPAAGMTALHDAIALGIERLAAGTHDKNALLIISDGGDNASGIALRDVLAQAEQSGAILYTIGLFDDDDPDRNPGALKRLARETGGEAYFPDKLSSVMAICESIAEEIRNQYAVGYFSTSDKPAGAFRSIRIVARNPAHRRLTLRTRTGYVAQPREGGEDH